MLFDIFMVVAGCTLLAMGLEAWTNMLLNVATLRRLEESERRMKESEEELKKHLFDMSKTMKNGKKRK